MEHQKDDVVVEKKLEQSDEPPLYNIIIHNDDFTPVIFVIELIMVVFGMSYDDAEAITHQVHTQDKAVVGAFTKEIAEMKVEQMNATATRAEHPLKTTMEKG